MDKCKHNNAYFVGTVGAEYCPDCEKWNDFEEKPKTTNKHQISITN